MVSKVDVARVGLWNLQVGAVAWDEGRGVASFEYEPEFLERGLDLAPLHMSLESARRGSARYEFRTLPRETFLGLPGLLADALPDRFGNSLIDAWLARQGRAAGDFSPVERLCYIGRRAIGALEFSPAVRGGLNQSVPVEVSELVDLAQAVLSERSQLRGDLAEGTPEALVDILRVSTSAGGGRPKAVIAFNPETSELRSGQVDAPAGFEHWILKFDGVRDDSLGDPAGYGRIEFAYHEMAVAASITMAPCRLLEENGRAHFMTRRFDRPSGDGKLHMQSLCAMAHLDFNAPGSHSYEQAFQVMRRLRLPHSDMEQQYRRMVFNVVARNQDDHTKNIAYLMDTSGRWSLSPAYDLTFAFNPQGQFTSQHQMTIAGKRDGITREDLLSVGREMSVKKAAPILEEIAEAVADWPRFARKAGVETGKIDSIARAHRLLED